MLLLIYQTTRRNTAILTFTNVRRFNTDRAHNTFLISIPQVCGHTYCKQTERFMCNEIFIYRCCNIGANCKQPRFLDHLQYGRLPAFCKRSQNEGWQAIWHGSYFLSGTPCVRFLLKFRCHWSRSIHMYIYIYVQTNKDSCVSYWAVGLSTEYGNFIVPLSD